MLHASTSPFYPLFASLDVGAQMMKGRSGEVLWDDTIRLGIELRKKLRAVRREFDEKEKDPARRWFFDPFVPDRVAIPDVAATGASHDVAWESVATDQLARHAQYWELAPGAAWHGFTQVEEGFAITDPVQAHLAHARASIARPAPMRRMAIPAPIVAQYLRENRVVPEKNDLNSLLFLLTPGVESSKAGTLVSALVAFKRLHDDNALLDDVMPEFVAKRPKRYKGVRLRDLCAEMHAFFRDANVSALAEGAVSRRASARNGHDAARGGAPTRAQQCRLSAASTRSRGASRPRCSSSIRRASRRSFRAKGFAKERAPMIEYLKTFERGANTFPGFEAEIQGLYREVDATGAIRFYTYVARE